MNQREAVLSLLDPAATPPYTPAGFFLHFDPQFHRGQAAIDKHLEFFRATGMDFIKIQFENGFPGLERIQKPEDWANMPLYGLDFYEAPLRIAEGLVQAAQGKALVLQTLYSPFMCACHTAGTKLLEQHIRENPAAVQKGMEIITESLMGFVKALADLGIDGFYASTQGGEAARFSDTTLFETCVKPYDLAIMNEFNRSCTFNILHICDYELPYNSLDRFLDYPGQVVNAALAMADGTHITPQAVSEKFGRPFMGGMERKGILATGSVEQVRAEARRVLDTLPPRAILAADCTVPSSTPWENLRAAIEEAHK